MMLTIGLSESFCCLMPLFLAAITLFQFQKNEITHSKYGILSCKLLVKRELETLAITYKSIELGKVELENPLSVTNKNKLSFALQNSGLELMYDEKSIMIEKIINLIIEMVLYTDNIPTLKFPTFLSENVQQDYHKMSLLFAKTKGITIEQFIISHKVEKNQ